MCKAGRVSSVARAHKPPRQSFSNTRLHWHARRARSAHQQQRDAQREQRSLNLLDRSCSTRCPRRNHSGCRPPCRNSPAATAPQPAHAAAPPRRPRRYHAQSHRRRTPRRCRASVRPARETETVPPAYFYPISSVTSIARARPPPPPATLALATATPSPLRRVSGGSVAAARLRAAHVIAARWVAAVAVVLFGVPDIEHSTSIAE
jgi:hypothetical protein